MRRAKASVVPEGAVPSPGEAVPHRRAVQRETAADCRAYHQVLDGCCYHAASQAAPMLVSRIAPSTLTQCSMSPMWESSQ